MESIVLIGGIPYDAVSFQAAQHTPQVSLAQYTFIQALTGAGHKGVKFVLVKGPEATGDYHAVFHFVVAGDLGFKFLQPF